MFEKERIAIGSFSMALSLSEITAGIVFAVAEGAENVPPEESVLITFGLVHFIASFVFTLMSWEG